MKNGIKSKTVVVQKNVVYTCSNCRELIKPNQKIRKWNYYSSIKKRSITIVDHINCDDNKIPSIEWETKLNNTTPPVTQ